MEQNYSEKLKSSNFNEDALLMQQVVGDDYELLAIDMMLHNLFAQERDFH